MKKILTVFLCLLQLHLLAQNSGLKEFNSLNIFYVDNGRDNYRQGLKDYADLMQNLKESIDEVATMDNARFMLFQPNKFDPQIEGNIKSRDSYVAQLYKENEYSTVNFLLDNKAILNYINITPCKVLNNLNMYYYLQGDFVVGSIEKSNGELSKLIRLLPQELFSLTNCPANKLNVYIRVSRPANSTKSSDWIKENLLTILNFYNKADEPNYIKIQIEVYDEQ